MNNSEGVGYFSCNYLKALKKNLETRAVKQCIKIDLNSPEGNQYPNKPSIIEVEDTIFRILKIEQGDIQRIRICPGYKNMILIELKKEVDIGVTFAHVEDDFVIRSSNGNMKGIMGSVRGLKAQRKDKDGNPIIFEKKITVHSPHEDITDDDINRALKEYGEVTGPVKECTFKEGRLKGLMNGNYTVNVTPKCEIPGFIPIKGLRTRVSYMGQNKFCARCFHFGHFAKECSNKSMKWREYLDTIKSNEPNSPSTENVNSIPDLVVLENCDSPSPSSGSNVGPDVGKSIQNTACHEPHLGSPQDEIEVLATEHVTIPMTTVGESEIGNLQDQTNISDPTIIEIEKNAHKNTLPGVKEVTAENNKKLKRLAKTHTLEDVVLPHRTRSGSIPKRTAVDLELSPDKRTPSK
ncbi:Hypothetical protein FKW44_004658, partial [Caligus rogercresseyi]